MHASIGTTAPVEPEPIRLVYSAPAGCPDGATFFVGLAARAHVVQIEDGDAREFRVTIEQTDDVAKGTLVVVSKDGEAAREVTGKTCDETVTALELVAALAIEQRAAEAEDRMPQPPVVQPRAPRPWHLSAGAGVEIETGIAPGALGALPVFVAATHGAAGLQLRLGATITEQDTVTMAVGTSSFRWTVGWLEACPLAAKVWRLVGRACAGAEAGALQGRGEHVGSPSDLEQPWLAPRASLAIALGIGPVNLALGARAATPVLRDRFYLAPSTTIYETPWITAGFGLDASIQLR
jgi:hypothetical protein